MPASCQPAFGSSYVENQVSLAHNFSRNRRRLRHRLASAPLLESLEVIHAYISYLQFDTPLPIWIKPIDNFGRMDRVEAGLFEWELDVLCRELLLSGSRWGTRDLAHWDELADAINHIKDLQTDVLNAYPDILDKNILTELFRIQNQQFPWQIKRSSRWLVRYLKIFSQEDLNALIVRKVGLPIEKILRIGLAFFAIFMKRFNQSLPIEVGTEFANPDEISTFIKHFSGQFFELFKEGGKTMSINDDYIYTRNPLVVNPMILHDFNGRLEVICPIPNYLIRRVSEGLYYEICDLPRFSDHFGSSFQKYVGEGFEAANRAGNFAITPEVEYTIGKQRKDTVDWIVSDKTASLFVECKTKRITYLAKTRLLDSAALKTDIEKFGAAVAQNYKALKAALDGEHPNWKPDGRPVYPVVVMLEDFYAAGLDKQIHAAVVEELRKANIDPELIDEYPYTLASVWDLELATLIMSEVGIEAFMSKKVRGEPSTWDVHSFIMNFFRDKLKGLNGNLFPKEMDRIVPGPRA